jgi:intein/homing endonuclease
LILKKYGGADILCKTSIEESELDKKPYIKIPDRYFYSNAKKICGFLRGLFSANGNVLCNNKSR